MRQGKLADCYLLSVLASLAEIPGRVESLFNTKTVNSAGIYSINIFVNGKQQEVVIDDYMPCDPNDGQPCFASSQDEGEIWAMLIEKAWAKVCGAYCNIHKFCVISITPHFTGAPIHRFDHVNWSNLNELWEILKDSSDR